MDKEAFVSALTLCNRARDFVYGMGTVSQALKSSKAKSVYAAQDISEKTRKEITFLCLKYNTKLFHTPFTMDEYWFLTGKRTGIFAVTQQGFSDKLSALACEETPNL